MNILVINGPNLNMLGIRDKNIYGDKSYKDLVRLIKDYCKKNNVKVKCVQSNYEGKIIDYIQKSLNKVDGIVINAGAYTHYSIAIKDALNSVKIKCVEVHISNIYEREDFRRVSVIKDECIASIVGKGFNGYLEAIDALLEKVR
jgi:3-dehydroquinate dehydratase-2